MADTFKHQRLFDEKDWYRKQPKYYLRNDFGSCWLPPEPKDIDEPPDIEYHKRVNGKKFWRTHHWRAHRHLWRQIIKKEDWVRFERLSRKPHDFLWDIT
jgi:hypothetical protein